MRKVNFYLTALLFLALFLQACGSGAADEVERVRTEQREPPPEPTEQPEPVRAQPGYWLRLGGQTADLQIVDWRLHHGTLLSLLEELPATPANWLALGRPVPAPYDLVPFRYELERPGEIDWQLVTPDALLAGAEVWQEVDVQEDGTITQFAQLSLAQVDASSVATGGLRALRRLYMEWYDADTESVLWIDTLLFDQGNNNWIMVNLVKPPFTIVDNAPYEFGCVFPEPDAGDEEPRLFIQELRFPITSTLRLPELDLDRLMLVPRSAIDRTRPFAVVETVPAPTTTVREFAFTPILTRTLIMTAVAPFEPSLEVVDEASSPDATCRFDHRFSGESAAFDLVTTQPDPDQELVRFYVTEPENRNTVASCSTEAGECYSFLRLMPSLGDLQAFLCINKFACDEKPDQTICKLLSCASVIEGLDS